MTFNPQVSSHGYGSAEIFFLSGYPLKEDLNSGLALNGSSERLLNKFLHPHNIQIRQTYRASFIKEKLNYSGTTYRRLKQTLSSIDSKAYEKLLFDEIKYVSPNVIVPLDDLALEAVYPNIKHATRPKNRKNWIYCYRGSILPLREDWQAEINHPIRVIPTLGPLMLYKDYTANSYVSLDYQRIVANKSRRTAFETNILRWIVKSNSQLNLFLERARIKGYDFLVFDIETFGGLLTCIGFCFDGYEGISIPLMDDTIPTTERALMWRTVARVLESQIPKVNQNIKYDWTILERHGFTVNNIVGDTMVLSGLIYPELPKGLDFLTSIYTDIAYYKDEGKEFNPKAHTKDRLYLYNALDTISTNQIYTKQLKEAEEAGVKELYNRELVPLIKHYKDMDNLGLLVDQERKNQLNEKYFTLFDRSSKLLASLVGDDNFNPRSPKQVADLIYKELKFPKRVRTSEAGQITYRTDKESLDDLSISHPLDNKVGKVGHEILLRIIVCRKLAKVIEYINTPLHPDGRLHGVSNLSGTETGRSSFSKSLDEIWSENKLKFIRLGRSLQTITKHGFHVDEDIFDDFEDANIASDLRSIFVPTPGHVFIEGDGSQAEARWVAVLAEDWELLESFDKTPKIHSKTAALFFNIDPNLITKDQPIIPKIGITYYDLGKRTRHAAHYDMHEFRLSQMTHLPLNECIRMLKLFHNANPKIREVYHTQIIKFVQKFRYLITPFKRRRDFFAKFDNSLIKEALAYIPQSGVSDHTKFSIPRIQDKLDFKVRFLVEQHDSILSEIPKDRKEDYCKVFKEIYERPVNFINCSLSRDFNLITPAELFIGEDNWQEMKESSNYE